MTPKVRLANHAETSGIEAGFLRRYRPMFTWLLRALIIVTLLWVTTALGRAPSRGNEAAAIGAIRAVFSAENTFAGVSGHYGSWACLAAPGCLPGRRVVGGFISPTLADTLRQSGYRLDLLGAALDQVPEDPASGPLFARYAVVAQPVGLPAGRWFCGDDTGRIFGAGLSKSEVRDGHCVDRSTPIR